MNFSILVNKFCAIIQIHVDLDFSHLVIALEGHWVGSLGQLVELGKEKHIGDYLIEENKLEDVKRFKKNNLEDVKSFKKMNSSENLRR